MEVFAAGVVVGMMIAMLLALRIKVGVIRVVIDDPNENPYLFLELAKDANDIPRRKYVLMKVDQKVRYSQE